MVVDRGRFVIIVGGRVSVIVVDLSLSWSIYCYHGWSGLSDGGSSEPLRSPYCSMIVEAMV